MIFDSGSSPPHGAEGNTPPAALNEGADPHYPFKDILIGAACTDAGLSERALQYARQSKKICVTVNAPILHLRGRDLLIDVAE